LHGDQLNYNKEEDYVVCPMGQHMKNIGSHKEQNKSGYEQHIANYQAKNFKRSSLMVHVFQGSVL